MNENFVNLELFEIQLSFFHHGLGLLNFLYFITLFLFNSSKKRTFLKTLSILNYFRPNCLFLPWSWVIFLINAIQITSIQFNSIQINSIQFNSIQINFVLLYFKKEHFQKLCQFLIISGLAVFFHHGLWLFYFLYLTTLFHDQFNSIDLPSKV